MNCEEARFAVAANPSASAAGLAEHLAACESCAAYANDMRTLDAGLRRAMSDVPMPRNPGSVGLHAVASRPVRRPFARQLAMAAGIAAVAVLAGVLWIGVPRESLASAVVGHMAHEPDAWTRTGSLPPVAVTKVLAKSGVTLRTDVPGVSYASSCWFRGHYVPHLVVRTPDGPVTVMVLPREQTARRTEFQEEGYRGVLVPAGRGSVAVLARDATDVTAVANRVLASIQFEGQ
jgi:hypothetical protein